MKKRLYLACLALIMPMAGTCAEDDGVIRQAIEEAKSAQQQADALQGAWTTTDTLIKEAETAAAAGDNDKALALARKAKSEAGHARAQAEYEMKHWSPPPYAHPK